MRFEAGTPNITGAVGLLAALEYFESIGGYARLESIERPLIHAMLDRFEALGDRIELVGPKDGNSRTGIFSFNVPGVHVTDLADAFAEKNVCVRSGYHCAEPLAAQLGIDGSLRASLYLYNDEEDINAFFQVLESITN